MSSDKEPGLEGPTTQAPGTASPGTVAPNGLEEPAVTPTMFSLDGGLEDYSIADASFPDLFQWDQLFTANPPDFTNFLNEIRFISSVSDPQDIPVETQQQPLSSGISNVYDSAAVPGSLVGFPLEWRSTNGNPPSALPVMEQTLSREATLSLPICRTLPQETVTGLRLQDYADRCSPATLSLHPFSMGASPDGTAVCSSGVVRGKKREITDGTGHEAARDERSNTASLPAAKRRTIDLVSEPPRTVATYTDGVQTQGFAMVHGTSSRKPRARYSDQAKKDVANNRLKGVCNYCRRSKRRCDLHQKSKYEPCSNCANIKFSKMPRMPCFQSKITDCIFFRKGPSWKGPQYFERQAVYELSDIPALPGYAHQAPEAKRLELSQIRGKKLIVYVDKYEPKPGDKLDWTKLNEEGEKFTMKMPPYCLTDMDKNRANMKEYICTTRHLYLSMLQNGTELTWLTAQMAMRYADSNRGSMTDMALDLWAYCRVIELPWKICGDDTLGVEKGDPRSPWPGFVPVTPIIDVQLDQIVIKDILQDLREKLLKGIAKAVDNYSPGRWLDCYLAIFIILNHIECAAGHCHRFALTFGISRRFSDMRLVEGWFHSSKILLSRFHYVSNGSGPFRIDWDNKKATQFAQLDNEQLDFVKQVQNLAISRDEDFQNIRAKNQYERDTYWTHQMLDKSWTAGSANIEEIVLD